MRPGITDMPATDEGQHPIQVVARRTGLSADVIRAWEKRYRVVTPVRSTSGRRLYSNADINRLRLLARATRSGRTISQVVALDDDALVQISRADSVEATPLPSLAQALTPCLDAVERFDAVALDAELRRAVVALSADAFIETLVVPLRATVVARIDSGALHAAHEHLALAALRRALGRIIDTSAWRPARPGLIVSTPPGQTQELGALVTAATAASEGWFPLYLGAGVPAEAVAEAAARTAARALALSLGDLASDRIIGRELRRLRSLLDPDVAILVDGATNTHRGILREIDAVVLGDAAAQRAWFRARRDEREHNE